MPQRTLSSDFDYGSREAPPSYDTSFTPEEFEAKAAAVAEETGVSHGKQRAEEDSGPPMGLTSSSGNYDEFEDWDDAKFEAAAAAYQLRLSRMQQSASSQDASSSTNRAQSPRRDAGRPVASTSRATSPRPSGRSAPLKTSMHSPGQLPVHHFDSSTQRNLPQQSDDVYPGAPSHSHNQQPTYTPQQAGPSQAEANQPPQWTSGASSDGHGRASMDVPPPFASMDPSMDYASSPTDESQPSQAFPPHAHSEVHDERYSTIPPPLPSDIPQAPVSAPLQPTIPSSPPAFVPPPVMHRHSDVPQSGANIHNVFPPARPRLSDVPSIRGRPNGPSSARTPPPTFSGPHHPGFPGFVLPYDKKPTVSQATSRSQALYASANVKMNSPSVKLDLNKLAYSEHGQNQPAHGMREESHPPASFYSSSVSSVIKKRALPQPQQRRITNEPQYSAHALSPQNNPYELPFGAGPPMPTAHYGQSVHAQHTHGNPGFYPHPHMQVEANMQMQGYPSHFSEPQQQHHQPHHQQRQHAAPQGYPPTAMQNHWAPDTWSNYGRP